MFCSCSTISNIVKKEFAERNPEDILQNTAAEYIVNPSIEGEPAGWIASQMGILKIMLSEQKADSVLIGPVSYTHLTLPTSDLV